MKLQCKCGFERIYYSDCLMININKKKKIRSTIHSNILGISYICPICDEKMEVINENRNKK